MHVLLDCNIRQRILVPSTQPCLACNFHSLIYIIPKHLCLSVLCQARICNLPFPHAVTSSASVFDFFQFSMALASTFFRVLSLCILVTGSQGNSFQLAPGPTHQYEFNVQYTTLTRLCRTKRIVTVNGEFPGPTICVREGERAVVKVINRLEDRNVTIHWHGVRQMRTCWSDGPAYITQCPIQPGHSFVYNFTITGQRGTLFWHAHISWLRATVHGAFVIFPRLGVPYPFDPQPFKEIPIVLGEWWNADVEAVISQALQSGAGPNVSDAYTINGQPGFLYDCSAEDAFSVAVDPNETYLLRIINAGLNNELFFGIAEHNLTVVEIDASYTKPLETQSIRIAPGQTVDALLVANRPATTRYIIAARAYSSSSNPFDNTTVTATLDYYDPAFAAQLSDMPRFPDFNDTNYATTFSKSLRSLASIDYPAKVPQLVDRELFFTVGLARKPCPSETACQGPSGGKFAASVNNISFTLPQTALLQAFFLDNKITTANNGSQNLFATDFPDNPATQFNYTGPQPANLTPQTGTRLSRLPFNASVQLILQDTSILGTESHPIHLHGYNFFVIGQGMGDYNRNQDPANFNLVDPPERNTVSVPKGGWAAIRFRSDNPGVWFLHCHLEIHTSWGLETAFLVPNGVEPDQSLVPPPPDFPAC